MLNTSIKLKVMFGYAAILLVTSMIGLTLFYKTTDVALKNQQFVEITLPLLRLTEEANSLLNSVHMTAYAFYGTTLSLDEFEQQISRNKTQLDENLKEIIALQGDHQTKALVVSENTVFDTLAALKRSMTASPTDWDAARANLAAIEAIMQKNEKLISDLKMKTEDQANIDSNMIQQKIEDIHLFILLGGLAVLLIFITGYLIVLNTIVRPLVQLSEDLAAVAENMDLTKTIGISANDELGLMSRAINKLINAFREGSQSTRDSASQLLTSAEEMEKVASNAKTQIQTFSSNIKQLTDQISTFEDNILEAASRSRCASETARTGAGQVQTGAQNVDNTAQSIARLTEDLELSSENLLALKTSGDQVSAVVSTIAAIAEQTNLLALNAAIEAARAGESGRGFAVVADEVRLLATRTHESTHQINQILDTILHAITDAVSSMNSNKQKASLTVGLVNQTVNSLTEIQQTILQLSDENGGLASLAKQNEQVIANMRSQLDDVSNANEVLSQAGGEISSSSSRLTGLAATLYKIANLFKS